jgi:hypothetical protein
MIKTTLIKFFLIFTIIWFPACESEKNKSKCIVTGKRYMPAESGDGATFENERNLIYIKRLSGKPFLFGSTETILNVDKSSYSKLKVGDTLSKIH